MTTTSSVSAGMPNTFVRTSSTAPSWRFVPRSTDPRDIGHPRRLSFPIRQHLPRPLGAASNTPPSSILTCGGRPAGAAIAAAAASTIRTSSGPNASGVLNRRPGRRPRGRRGRSARRPPNGCGCRTRCGPAGAHVRTTSVSPLAATAPHTPSGTRIRTCSVGGSPGTDPGPGRRRRPSRRPPSRTVVVPPWSLATVASARSGSMRPKSTEGRERDERVGTNRDRDRSPAACCSTPAPRDADRPGAEARRTPPAPDVVEDAASPGATG